MLSGMTRRENLLAYGAWAAVCVFWGTTYLGIRIGLETLPPALFGGARFSLAGAILLAFMRARGARLPRGREWLSLGVVGVMLLGVANGIVAWAEQWVPSSFAALILATSPFWLVGLDSLTAAGERFSRRLLAGFLLGLSGMALLVAPKLFGAQFDAFFLVGALSLQFGSLSWCAGSVYAKRRPVAVAPLMAAAAQMLSAGAFLLLVGTIFGEWPRFHFNGRTLAAFVYLLVFGSLVGYSAYTYIVQKLPLSVVALHSYINPIIAVLLGWLILSEPLNWRVGLAAAVILCGVALVKTAPQAKTPAQSATAALPAAPAACAANQ
jgi:drug/metabolite transporter (DMT)-like permease